MHKNEKKICSQSVGQYCMNDKSLVSFISVAGCEGDNFIFYGYGNAFVNVRVGTGIGKDAVNICGAAFRVLVFAD